MHCRANHKYLLFALLPLLIIAAVFFGGVPKKANAVADKAPLSLSKAVTTAQHDAPFVSNDVPQISRAEYRSPQNPALAIFRLSNLSASGTYYKGFIVFTAVNYSCLFKTLFPAHEFS